MGKLTETLEKVYKGSGGGLGFGRPRAQVKPRAAGIVVALGQADAALAEAVAKAGVEGALFTAQRGKGSKATLSAEEYHKAAEPLKVASLPWGLDLSEVAGALEPEALKALREGGVDFVSFPLGAPARLLKERPEGLDRIISLGALSDDPMLLLARSVNLLSVQVAQFDFGLTPERLRALTIEDLLRYRMLRETIRFPALYSVTGELGAEEAHTLVKMGASALLVQAEAGITAAALGKRLVALREELERVPTREEEGETPSLAGLSGTAARVESQKKTEDDSIRQY